MFVHTVKFTHTYKMNYIVDLTFLGFIFITGLSSIAAEELPDKIMGGTETSPGEFPWIVAIRISTPNFTAQFCAGVIYNENWIVTAAHCGCYTNNQYEVVAGEYRLTVDDKTEQIRSVSNITCHPDFNANTTENDISIWRVSSPFDLNHSSVKAAQLAQKGFIPVGNVTVAGWGYINGGGPNSDILLKVTVPISDYTFCRDWYYYTYGININQYSQICAGDAYKGSCNGDSGGPVHCDSTVCGIVSFGTPDCGNPSYPGVSSNVAYFYEWISMAPEPKLKWVAKWAGGQC